LRAAKNHTRSGPIANRGCDEPHPAAAELTLERFARGYVIDERGAGPQPNLH